jgi:hypothetical protein
MPSRRLNWLWDWATRLAALRPARPDADQLARHDWPANKGVRPTESLRDAWRTKWLKLSRGD